MNFSFINAALPPLCFRENKIMAPKLPSLGVDEIKNDPKGFGKALFAELLGTAILVSQPGSETSQCMFLEKNIIIRLIDHVFASANTFYKGVCWVWKLHGRR